VDHVWTKIEVKVGESEIFQDDIFNNSLIIALYLLTKAVVCSHSAYFVMLLFWTYYFPFTDKTGGKHVNGLELNEKQKLEELNSDAVNVVQLQNKINQLENNITKLNEECASLKVLVNNYKFTVDQRSKTKDETKKLKDRLNEEVKKTSELEKKVEKMNELEKNVEKVKELEKKLEKMSEMEKKIEHYENTLVRAEKDLEKIGKTADQEFKSWSQKVEKTEKAFLEISKEHEKLKQESSAVAK